MLSRMSGQVSDGDLSSAWLDVVESKTRHLYVHPQARAVINVYYEDGLALMSAAMLDTVFSFVTTHADVSPYRMELQGKYSRFGTEVRASAIARFGNAFQLYLREIGEYTCECNSISMLAGRGQAPSTEDLLYWIEILGSVWASYALNGQHQIRSAFVPSRNLITEFAGEIQQTVLVPAIDSWMDLCSHH